MSDTNKQSDAGQDKDMVDRLERDPESKEARLDTALDHSMDASDPPSSTQPVHNQKPAPSSGYDAEKEAKLKDSEKGEHAHEAERQQDA